MFRKATLSYPLYELIKQYSKQFRSHKVLGRGGGGGGGGGWGCLPGIRCTQDLAAICVAPLRSVLEYNVAWLDITPLLPICLVQ